MTHKRYAPVALAVALLTVATPALAGNGGAYAGHVEQLGPKYLLGPRTVRTRPLASTKTILPITFRTLEVEELGPKYLLH